MSASFSVLRQGRCVLQPTNAAPIPQGFHSRSARPPCFWRRSLLACPCPVKSSLSVPPGLALRLRLPRWRLTCSWAAALAALHICTSHAHTPDLKPATPLAGAWTRRTVPWAHSLRACLCHAMPVTVSPRFKLQSQQPQGPLPLERPPEPQLRPTQTPDSAAHSLSINSRPPPRLREKENCPRSRPFHCCSRDPACCSCTLLHPPLLVIPLSRSSAPSYICLTCSVLLRPGQPSCVNVSSCRQSSPTIGQTSTFSPCRRARRLQTTHCWHANKHSHYETPCRRQLPFPRPAQQS